MEPAITIRGERPGDAATIADVVRRAYADVAYSDHREHRMVDRLRESDAFLPALSLLSEIDGAAAGHILLTRAMIRGDDRPAMPVLALAPLSVVPERQRQGVGKRLVAAAHDRAAALGYAAIVLVGLPDYYPRFGYEPLGDYPVTLPFDAPAGNCMVHPLAPGALARAAGRVVYAEAWLDH